MKQTIRGFDIIEFKDVSGNACSLQKSSIAMQERIWLGVNVNRMHLSQAAVKKLLPYLKLFVDTGNIK